MKKIILFGVFIYFVSCSNPEDRATGNPDSTKFSSDEGKVLNSKPGPTDPNSQSDMGTNGTSAGTSSSASNDSSNAKGINRSYGTGGDSTKH